MADSFHCLCQKMWNEMLGLNNIDDFIMDKAGQGYACVFLLHMY